MATFALLNAFAHVHGHDFSCESNELTLSMDVAALDATTFCSNGWAVNAPGLKTSSLSMAGFWAPAPDEQTYDDLGGEKRAVTVGVDAANGGVAYLLRSGLFNYQQGGAHGELAPFSLTAQGSDGWGVLRGRVLAAKQTVDSTGVIGAPFQLGAASASQHLYATFHVFGAGTTITVVLESDSDNTFGSATTRATIGPLTATGGVWVPRVSGAITDTWYRLRVTAITGEFTVAGAAAIA